MSLFKKDKNQQDVNDKTPKVKKKFKVRFVVIPLIVLIVGGLIVNSVVQSNTPTSLNAVEVGKDDLSKTIETSGTIASDEIKVYFAGADGKLETVNVSAGDEVKAGDILYTYNEDERKHALDTASTKLAAAEYNYKDTIDKNTKATEEVAKTDENIKNLEYYKQQDAKKGTDEVTLANYEANIAENKTKNEIAKEKILTEYELKALEANRHLEALTDNYVIDSLNAVKDGISCDFNGIVVDVKAVNGATVMAGAEMMTISRCDKLHVNILLSKNELKNVEIGQSADVIYNDETYSGKVSKISRTATKSESGSTVVAAEIEIDNPDSLLVLGAEANVVIHAKEILGAVVIPNECLYFGTEGAFVYVEENGLLTKKPITKGMSNEMYTEVKDGLKEGDVVIMDDVEYLEEGIAVTTIVE